MQSLSKMALVFVCVCGGGLPFTPVACPLIFFEKEHRGIFLGSRREWGRGLLVLCWVVATGEIHPLVHVVEQPSPFWVRGVFTSCLPKCFSPSHPLRSLTPCSLLPALLEPPKNSELLPVRKTGIKQGTERQLCWERTPSKSAVLILLYKNWACLGQRNK